MTKILKIEEHVQGKKQRLQPVGKTDLVFVRTTNFVFVRAAAMGASAGQFIEIRCSPFGANGKSCDIAILKEALGDYVGELSGDVLTTSKKQSNANTLRNQLRHVAGKRLIVVDEVSPGASWNTSLIQKMTTGNSNSTIEVKTLFKDTEFVK